MRRKRGAEWREEGWERAWDAVRNYGIYEREPGLATGTKSYSSDVRYVVPSSDERVVS